MLHALRRAARRSDQRRFRRARARRSALRCGRRGAVTSPPTVEPVLHRGIACFKLRAGGASAVVARLGAQVLSWVPADGRERLFVSERARFDGSVAIRGGIPVCFPQFSGLGALPKHGLVRTRVWNVLPQEPSGATARVGLEIRDDADSRGHWPHSFVARIDVGLREDGLEVALTVRNTGAAPFAFTGALHTYFAVEDIAAASVRGLAGCEYRDAAGGNAICTESAPAVRFDGEVDRVYHDTPRRLALQDGPHALEIGAQGFPDTVVWNPGAILCAGLPDMEPRGYRRLICVEAAAARRQIGVAAGECWRGSQSLAVA
ncbi:MAG: D-hexose-6-phosphate mutarotase [Burkholderiales bacterium]|nr:D-hexose-6-phosphate mutarotase [Burkholderiales bacterium]